MLSRSFLNKSSSLLMLLLGMHALASLFAETFVLSLEPAFPWFLSALCLLFWFGAYGRKRFLLVFPLAVLTVYAAFRLYSSDVRAELLDLIERIGGVYYNYFTGKATSPEPSAFGHTALLLTFFFPLAFYFSQALTAARSRIFLVLIFYLPLTLVNLAVNGYPKPLTIFFLLLFYILLLIGGSLHSPDSARGGMLWTMLAPTALLILLCLLLADPEHYSFSEEDVARSRRFDQVSHMLSALVRREPVDPPRETLVPQTPRVSIHGVSGGHWSIRKEEMDMSGASRYADNERVVLRVKADTSECMYLRRSSYGDYAGKSWKLAEDEEGLVSLPFCAQAVMDSAVRHEATITLDGSSDLLLVPYFSAQAGEDDSFIRSDGSREYTLSYYSVGSEIYTKRLTGEAAERELVYRDYAHRVFTALPETTAFSAGRILEEAGIDPGDEQLIWEIASYVMQSGRYDLNTPAYQSSDYAVYFLTQAHRGYCIHFATAAAVLYRAAGIPARLTDGFMVTTKAGETVDVRLADQHAWVEVYIDGLGWVPVEATGSAGFYGDEGEPVDQLPSPFSPETEVWTVPLPTPSPTPSPTPTPTPIPTPESALSPAETETVPERPDESEAPVIPESTAETEPTPPSPWLLLIPAALLLILLRGLLLFWRRYRIRQKDRRKAAVAVWREARRLCRKETKIPGAIRSCAERAAFGRNAPDGKELQAAQASLRELERNAITVSSFPRRLRILLRGRIFK